MSVKRTLIIGLGKSGVAAYDLVEQEGDFVFGFDDKPSVLQSLSALGKRVGAEVGVQEFDRLILSPGVSPNHPLVEQAHALGIPVHGEAEFALQRLKQPAIAITGTNGKTTVTLLVAHILQTAGFSAKALGNVGVPLSSYVKDASPTEIAVIELSSYQLETLSDPLFTIGVILNITPDHLDRYGTMEAYAKAKCRLQNCLKQKSELWIHESVEKEFKYLLQGPYLTYGSNRDCTLWTDQVAFLKNSCVETILPTRYRDLGLHESENALAAWAICRYFGVSPEAFLKGLDSFQKPSHRIEWVATVEGVDYINDSKGTNIDATIKAVEAMKKPVILIAGGVDKGASYEVWKSPFASKVRHVVAIGEAAQKIEKDLSPEYQVQKARSLKEALMQAKELAREGEIVLLSPGCSSFDMFRDYAHRGDEFKRMTLELKERYG